jgi:hypothetical protein
VSKETGRGKRWWKAHELFADRRCGQAVLDFLSSTDVGKIVPTAEVEDNVESEVSEGERGEKGEREEEREAEVGELGAGDDRDAGEERWLLLPTPPLTASAEEE